MVQPVSPGQLPCSTSARSGLSRHRRSPPCGPIGASGLSLPGRLCHLAGCDPKGLCNPVDSVCVLGRRRRRPLAPGCTGGRRRIPRGLGGAEGWSCHGAASGLRSVPRVTSGSQKTGCANRIFNVLRPFPVCESMPRTTWVQGLFPRRNRDKS